ncbi:MAG: hypothetical protein ACRDY5_01755 [Acidimicrobiales bacterium]
MTGTAYLAGLSDDDVPALLGGLHRLSPQDRALVLATVCRRAPLGGAGGVWAYNGARDAATEARHRSCPG